MASTHINPIIPGFAPDPSIIRVEDDFFLVNSTFHMFPGLPIYTSKDLVSWKQIGNAIHRQDQLSLRVSSTEIWPKDENGDAMLGTGGLYAPTIRHHEDIFYIVCTNVIHEENSSDDKTENFIVSTRDIWAGKWSNPIYFDFDGIDPSLFFDEDGKSYIQGSAAPGPMTQIHLFEIDLATGKKLSKEENIWGGTGGIYPEGPHLYKKDGVYYLMISEGGTHAGHMITVARSKAIWGPYAAFEKNPILTARDTDEYVQYTGHGDIVQDGQGCWWAVCLACRKKDGRFNMGRETFLTAAEWPEGGWPELGQVKVDLTMPNVNQDPGQESTSSLVAEPMVDYLYIRDAHLEDHRFSHDERKITLTASKADISQWKEPVTFVGKRQRNLEGVSTVLMHNVPASENIDLKAGLAYYKDEHRYIKLFYDFSNTTMVLEIINNAKSITQTSQQTFEFEQAVELRAQYTETSFRFSFRNQGTAEWESFDELDTLVITGPDFVGPVIGIFATAHTEGIDVEFEHLIIQ